MVHKEYQIFQFQFEVQNTYFFFTKMEINSVSERVIGYVIYSVQHLQRIHSMHTLYSPKCSIWLTIRLCNMCILKYISLATHTPLKYSIFRPFSVCYLYPNITYIFLSKLMHTHTWCINMASVILNKSVCTWQYQFHYVKWSFPVY